MTNCFGHHLDLAIHKVIDDGQVNRVLRLCRQASGRKALPELQEQRDLIVVQEDKQLPVRKLKADCAIHHICDTLLI